MTRCCFGSDSNESNQKFNISCWIVFPVMQGIPIRSLAISQRFMLGWTEPKDNLVHFTPNTFISGGKYWKSTFCSAVSSKFHTHPGLIQMSSSSCPAGRTMKTLIFLLLLSAICQALTEPLGKIGFYRSF